MLTCSYPPTTYMPTVKKKKKTAGVVHAFNAILVYIGSFRIAKTTENLFQEKNKKDIKK